MAKDKSSDVLHVSPLKVPLAERARDALRAEVLRGRWAAGPLPSERQLAHEFQVSRPTIHVALIALRNENLVHESEEGAWRVAPSARSAPVAPVERRPEVFFLRNSRMMPDTTSILPMLDILRQKLYRIGYGLVLKDPYARGMRGLDRTLAQMEEEGRPAFYILASLTPIVHRWFDERRLPALVFGSRTPGTRLPGMDISKEATTRHAVQHLALRGHRHIALLDLPPAKSIGAPIFYEIFLRACAAWPKHKVVGMVETCAARTPAFDAALERLLARAHRPTAIFVTDAELAIALYTALAQHRIRIPQDMSVLVLYRWPILEAMRPQPTCYGHSWESFANRVVRIARNHVRLGVWPDKFWNVLPTLREGGSVARVTLHQGKRRQAFPQT